MLDPITATIFMEFWQREESVLQMKWNVRSLEYTISLRPEFLEKASKQKYSLVTGKMEPYIPKSQTAFQYIVTFVSLALLLFILVLVTFGVTVYRITVSVVLVKSNKLIILQNKHKALLASLSGALMSGTFIFIFKWFYDEIAKKLTDMENHRTIYSYRNAYIYKSYALAFANNYAAVFYIAFFKGKFYTYPGDLNLLTVWGGINTDLCDPTGCLVDLAILLTIIMVLKAIFSNITQVVIPKMKRKFNQTRRKVINQDVIPQWENEFLLAKVDEFFIVEEYMDMVIQYGFVNFFIIGFPLAPLFALINNLVELRVDASKVTASYRRPIPTRVTGLGAWLAIMQATTYIGTVTNALVIAFTSNFVEKIIWELVKGHNLELNYLNQTLSVFAMDDFKMLDNSNNSFKHPVKLCYYQGKRYPPTHLRKYKRRRFYWHHLAIKFAIVLIFEHIVIILKGLIAYAIPDIPFSVRQQIVYQEKMAKTKKILDKSKTYLKNRG